MKPFQRGSLPPHAFDPAHYMRQGMTAAEAARTVAGMREDTIWLNDRYQVNASRVKPTSTWPCDMIWLSIKRRDKQPIHDWRDLQEIKNLLVGPEHEAVELYPAESRLVDTSNQFHLFVFADPKVRLPFGWNERLVSGTTAAKKVGAVQRAFHDRT